MAKLCIYLPPFASDYTGVCSSLFDLNCLTAINDGSCCTAHYVYCDEPRWEKNVRPVLSTQLRTIDAVLGNDEKVINAVSCAAKEMELSMIALVGTPVPAITGMDMEGMACEIEDRTGICSFGFSTNGFDYYDRGIISAGKALISRFTRKADASEIIPHSVNILGMTPLDYGNTGNDTALKKKLEEAGWKVNAWLFMRTTQEQIENLAKAQVNLAVSAAGAEIGEYLKTHFGTPYAAAAPMGQTAFGELLETLEACSHGSDVILPNQYNLTESLCQSDCRKSEKFGAGDMSIPVQAEQPEGRILIIMDQIMGNSLRRAIELKHPQIQVDTAGFFGWNPAFAGKNDVHLKSERELLDLLRSGRYQTVIGDPLLADIPDMKKLRHIKLAHPAVSGQLHWKDVPNYLYLQWPF
ncbi:MAG: nitrogenase component 1 [Lachnospiraceae bacterium]|nr:nitrogenase component 1 [Lachnospiraceae bacterium]